MAERTMRFFGHTMPQAVRNYKPLPTNAIDNIVHACNIHLQHMHSTIGDFGDVLQNCEHKYAWYVRSCVRTHGCGRLRVLCVCLHTCACVRVQSNDIYMRRTV